MALRRDPDHYYRLPEWDRFPWLEHGFGTQAAVWPTEHRCATLKQTHSADVFVADGVAGCLGNGDALVANNAGPLLCVRTADCVPVLLVDPQNRAVGAIHAGWKGTVAEITLAAVERMRLEFGTDPEDLEAVIGPSIGMCCFEVGPEVAVRFARTFPERTDLNCQTRIDLPEANRRQLVVAGLQRSRIFVSGLCTYCGAGEFHSYRRQKEAAGRQVSVIAVRPRVQTHKKARGRFRSRQSV